MAARLSDRRPIAPSAVENLDAEIDRIAALNLNELRALWRETMGRPAPEALSKDLIARALAYRLQEQRMGGLDPHLRRRLASLAKPGAEPVRHLKIGSVIVREFDGKIHEVMVAPGGFYWAGQTYASLSAIASKITGTSWNGPRFFGLRGKDEPPQAEPQRIGGSGRRMRGDRAVARCGPDFKGLGRWRRRIEPLEIVDEAGHSQNPSAARSTRANPPSIISTSPSTRSTPSAKPARPISRARPMRAGRLSPERYDDGGLSGASLERPALQMLLEQVRAEKIDIIVVYKVDRLTRSLADFAKLVELFDEHGVSFVSVTQSFNTTSSMGRLTLNVLLSFAQFEREVIGERVRDKIAASKRKGIWVGGPVPLGYRSVGKKLEIVPEEAELVRKIFADYLRLGSIGELAAALEREGVRPKPGCSPMGRRIAAERFMVGPLAHILKNRFYIGEVVYRGEIHKGEHAPILERELFEAVQARLAERRVRAEDTPLAVPRPARGADLR